MSPSVIKRTLRVALILFAACTPARSQFSPPPDPRPHVKEELQKARTEIEQDREQHHAEDAKRHLNDKARDQRHDVLSYHADPKQPLLPFEAPPFGDRIDLTRDWLFQRGNNGKMDPVSPRFDDSDWDPIHTNRPLVMDEGINLNEIWYRRHVHLAPGSHSLALTISDFGGSYRVYVNGKELGGYGKMRERGNYLVAAWATYQIPDELLAQPQLVIAIHAYVGTVDRATFTLSDGISKSSAVYLGPTNVLYRDQQSYFDNAWSESPTVLTLWGILCLLAFALTGLIRKVPAYPLLAIYAGGHLISLLITDFGRFNHVGKDNWGAIPVLLATIVSELAAAEFARVVAAVPRKKWFTAIEILYALCYLSMLPANIGLLSFAIYGILWRTGYYLLLAVTLLLIATGVRRHKRDAYLLAAFTFAYIVYYVVWQALQYIVFDYHFLTYLANNFERHCPPGSTGDVAIVASFFTVVVLRTLRLVQERASIATEIEAARTMQQLLLARTTDPTPGFMVETAYLPAGELGGDFFLVLPVNAGEGGLFAIVGDVSGKGLRAAMRVSMILGVLRREPSRDPAAVLAALNDALHSESDTGFTTACCVRLLPTGDFVVANAGHIAPYLVLRNLPPSGLVMNETAGFVSHELQTPPALPLGLVPGAEYETIVGRLVPGQRLVLMSDGVPEARSKKGELYGFNRLTTLTLRSAFEIAHTAESFGQEDDITVLTITALTPTTNAAPPPPAAPPPRPVLV